MPRRQSKCYMALGPQRPAANEISPRALWEGGGVAQRKPPLPPAASPALGGPGRPQTVGTGSTFTGSSFAKLFFPCVLILPFARIFLFPSPYFTWLPTHAFMQQRATINVVVEPCFRASEPVPRAVRFVSHYFARSLAFCGHIIPATGLALGTILPVAVVMV